MKRTVRGKLVRVMVATLAIVSVATLSTVAYMNYRASQNNLREIEAHIRDGIDAKGHALAESHALALKGLVSDSAFTEIDSIVRRAVREDPDVVYGLFANERGQLWTYYSPARPPPSASPDDDPEAGIGLSPPPPAQQIRHVLALSEADWLSRTAQKRTTPLFDREVTEFAMPVTADDEFAGTLRYGLSSHRMREALHVARQESKDRMVKALAFLGVLGVLTMLLGATLAMRFAARITRPLGELADAANDIAAGDHGVRVKLASDDEVGMLGNSFNSMADQITRLIDESSERAKLEKELDLARDIQYRLVPSDDTMTLDCLELAAYFQPADRCGGDWWTCHALPDNRALLIIADVTGHGVPSTMIATAAKGACDAVRSRGEGIDCESLALTLNTAVYEASRGQFAMTAFVAIIDGASRKISWVNAGHSFPLLFNPTTRRMTALVPGGTPLGLDAETEYSEQSRELSTDDLLVLFTDGLIECENDTREQYGDRRLRKRIKSMSTSGVIELRDTLVASSTRFFGSTPRCDDITLMVVRAR